MGPKPSQPATGELFRPRLDDLLNMKWCSLALCQEAERGSARQPMAIPLREAISLSEGELALSNKSEISSSSRPIL